jgi:crotonobetainyl-CoA:carnitine CoA-transferase CaiB-like acyl-CoA transferase
VRPTTGARMKRIWQCRDGYVSFDMYGARLARNFMTPLVAWMAEEGAAPDFLKEIDWNTFDYFVAPPELVERVAEPIGRFFAGRTRDEFLWGGVARRCCIYPVATPGDVATSRQLEERRFWVEIEHPALGAGVRYPGSCIRASETDSGVSRRAPRVGEHNVAVYGELGLSRKELVTLRRRGVI